MELDVAPGAFIVMATTDADMAVIEASTFGDKATHAQASAERLAEKHARDYWGAK